MDNTQPGGAPYNVAANGPTSPGGAQPAPQAPTPPHVFAARPVAAGQDAVLQRLAAVEALLQKQCGQNRRGMVLRIIAVVLMAILVLVLAAGVFVLAGALSDATSQMPELMRTATDSFRVMRDALEEMRELNFEPLLEFMRALPEIP